MYCDYCGIFAAHPEIVEPCKRKSDLLAEVQRREALQREYKDTEQQASLANESESNSKKKMEVRLDLLVPEI